MLMTESCDNISVQPYGVNVAGPTVRYHTTTIEGFPLTAAGI